MKILKAMREAFVSRSYVCGRMRASFRDDPSEIMSMPDKTNAYRFDVTVGCVLTGPEDALPVLRRNAERVLLHEIFGELQGDLMDLRDALLEEGIYREPNDPVTKKLNAVLDKVTGRVEA